MRNSTYGPYAVSLDNQINKSQILNQSKDKRIYIFSRRCRTETGHSRADPIPLAFTVCLFDAKTFMWSEGNPFCINVTYQTQSAFLGDSVVVVAARTQYVMAA